ncbi:ABC transporter ATP-binding protein [Nocardioides halotolerans]|uniref:ABC transporter ATP-binding protein n=1 Tax=Nocardioides halotolerans TaxID=433660 RepID=UPI0003FCCFA5|nr:ABC transporter ATP-binding protein [Nocardioides halotolerans]
MTAALEIDDLVAGYVVEPVLAGVSFEVQPAEVVCVLGPNGAGKTTLFKSICGLLETRSGAVRLAGDDVTRLRTERRARRGLVLAPEGRRLFPGLTVEENLTAGGFTGRDSHSVEAVLTLFPRLAERLSSAAGKLSGGEQQMLAVGRALRSGPRVLLIDEPSLGLAPMMVRAVFDVFRDLAAEGQAIVVAEQNVAEATRVADRCLVLSEGRIAFSAPTRTPEERAHVQAAYAELLAIGDVERAG